MFYLKEFIKSIGEAPLRGMFFLLFTGLLAMSLTHRSWITHTIDKVSPEKMTNPYFVAVLDGSVDVFQMKNLLNRLPGVEAIDDKETQRSRSKLNALVSQLGNDYNLSSELMNFKSLRVVMNPSLSIESLDFVRNQVVKVGGKDHVTATEIKYPEVTSVMKSHPFYHFLNRAGDWGVIAIIGVCWIISYWLCYGVFRSRSYIIEKFQRKQLVAAKSIASGLALILIICVALGIWNGTLRFLDSLVLFMVFSIFWTFSLQNWRWKPTL